MTRVCHGYTLTHMAIKAATPIATTVNTIHLRSCLDTVHILEYNDTTAATTARTVIVRSQSLSSLDITTLHTWQATYQHKLSQYTQPG